MGACRGFLWGLPFAIMNNAPKGCIFPNGKPEGFRDYE